MELMEVKYWISQLNIEELRFFSTLLDERARILFLEFIKDMRGWKQ